MTVGPDEVRAGLDAHDYLADDGLAAAVFLADRLARPLLLEGEPGVGKTEVANALHRWTGGRLLRVQCFEGIDRTEALYAWDHARQLLHVRVVEATGGSLDGAAASTLEEDLYGDRFLLRRPLLEAISHDPADGPPPVLLIDELDRADDEFEAFLLELLSDWAVSIPERGRIVARVPPRVVITSNRTRDLHDALKRRCLYHWLDHPDPDRERAIIERRAPGVRARVAADVASAVAALRTLPLLKPPGVAEAVDWSLALDALGVEAIDEASFHRTLGAVLKHREDTELVRGLPIERVLGVR